MYSHNQRRRLLRKRRNGVDSFHVRIDGHGGTNDPVSFVASETVFSVEIDESPQDYLVHDPHRTRKSSWVVWRIGGEVTSMERDHHRGRGLPPKPPRPPPIQPPPYRNTCPPNPRRRPIPPPFTIFKTIITCIRLIPFRWHM